jgi:hypothetical protein
MKSLATAQGTVISKWAGGADPNPFIFYTQTGCISRKGTIAWWMHNSPGSGCDYNIVSSPNVNVTDGIWHYVVFTRNAGTLELYIDGSLDNTSSVSDLDFSSSADISIGRYRTGDVGTVFDGSIDEVRIYRRALAPEEIRTHYLRGSGHGASGAITANVFRVVNTSGTARMYMDEDGRFGFGTTNPQASFHVNGTGSHSWAMKVSTKTNYGLISQASGTSAHYPLLARDPAGTNLFWIQGDGTGYLKAAAWTYGSDRRLKENIDYGYLANKGLDKILALEPVRFDYISGTKNAIGFIAQDVQSVIPEAVSITDEDTGYLGLKSNFIISYLVESVKELKSENDEITQKVQQQQEQIEELQQELLELKSK